VRTILDLGRYRDCPRTLVFQPRICCRVEYVRTPNRRNSFLHCYWIQRHIHVGSAQYLSWKTTLKEYTLFSVIAMLITLGLDIYITKTKVVTRGVFWIFLAVMYFFKLLMNGYLTWRPIVIYNPDHFMNLRIGTIPAEDFIYAFTLVTLPIILWEKLRKS